MRLHVLICLALVALTVVGFAPVCGRSTGFITIDDDEYVVANPHVNTGLSLANLRWAATAFHSNNWHPLTWVSLQVDAQFHGLAAVGYHRTNVLLHTVSAVLLFLALARMTAALWPSALVAALFAWHPLHVESVAWVSERKDVLSGVFWMLTLLAYSWYLQAPSWGRYGVLALVYGLGLTAKPMLVTLPLVLLLLDYWPLHRWSAAKPGAWRRLLLEKVPLLALAVGASLLTLAAQADVVKSVQTWPLGIRFGNALLSYVSYLGSAFWPSGLAIFYTHPGKNISLPACVAAAVFLAGITVLVLWQARRRPYLPVGWFWYLGTLLPVIGIVQVGLQARADRYTYLPLIGLFIMVVWGAAEIWSALRLPRLAAAACAGLVLAACLLVTHAQAGYWHDGVSVLEHAEQVTAPSATVEHCLGQALADAHRDAAAERHFRAALRIDPNDMFAHQDLGVLLGRKAVGDGETATAPARALLNDAVTHLRKAALLNPDSADVHSFLGETLAFLAQGDPQQAERYLREAIAELHIALELAPDSALANLNLAKAYLLHGDTDEAVKLLRKTLSIDPGSTEALQFLRFAEEMRRRRSGTH